MVQFALDTSISSDFYHMFFILWGITLVVWIPTISTCISDIIGHYSVPMSLNPLPFTFPLPPLIKAPLTWILYVQVHELDHMLPRVLTCFPGLSIGPYIKLRSLLVFLHAKNEGVSIFFLRGAVFTIPYTGRLFIDSISIIQVRLHSFSS